ncbi:MAG: IS110 family transposase [Saonia sp.]
MSESSIGIDVSKDRLDVHRLPDGAQAAFANSRAGLTKLIGWIGAGAIARIVFEPTGRYHRDLERRLSEAGYPLVKVNPRQARRFAEALGVRAKTDWADAAMLARMGTALALEPRAIRSETSRELNELITARRALIKDRTAAKNREKGLRLTLLRCQIAARITQINADLDAIDRLIADLIAADPALAARRDILTSIAGVSDVTAAMIIALAPELGSLDQRQIASLAGLAPITRQSGAWRGKAFIRGGRAALRETLYMPALVAIRFNPDLKSTYQRLTENGKPKKVALVAVMRKLIILANALIRENRKWTPKTP